MAGGCRPCRRPNCRAPTRPCWPRPRPTATAAAGCWTCALPPLAGPDLNEWFRDRFPPQIASALGGPLFTACLAGPHQRVAAESPEMELHLRHVATLDSYPLFYDDKAEAVTWLTDKQERAGVRIAEKSRLG